MVKIPFLAASRKALLTCQIFFVALLPSFPLFETFTLCCAVQVLCKCYACECKSVQSVQVCEDLCKFVHVCASLCKYVQVPDSLCKSVQICANKCKSLQAELAARTERVFQSCYITKTNEGDSRLHHKNNGKKC